MRINQSVATADTILSTQANSSATDNIISNLCMQTDNITEKTINQASKYDLTVEGYYTDVEIAGQTVSVDPMRVVGP